MGHWSSSKYSTDYEDEDDEEVNQPMLSPVHKEYPLPVEEPAKDDREPTGNEEEAPSAAEVEEEEEEKEKEAPVEVVDNILRPFHRGSPPCHATRSASSILNPPTRSWRMRMTPH
jgi:hypothetical protein